MSPPPQSLLLLGGGGGCHCQLTIGILGPVRRTTVKGDEKSLKRVDPAHLALIKRRGKGHCYTFLKGFLMDAPRENRGKILGSSKKHVLLSETPQNRRREQLSKHEV